MAAGMKQKISSLSPGLLHGSDPEEMEMYLIRQSAAECEEFSLGFYRSWFERRKL